MCMKIYTKTGDKGKTGLIGGKRVDKDCQRICAYGDIDELNAVLGLCREENDSREIGKILRDLQEELFVVGVDLAAPNKAGLKKGGTAGKSFGAKSLRITTKHTAHLEKTIDGVEKKLPPLKNFILPSGSDGACFLHLARTVCRRAERSVVALSRREKINPEMIVYLNRLGDLLFVMARLANKSEKMKEEKVIF
jgi:cob(I)alamin adenosyltransferase